VTLGGRSGTGKAAAGLLWRGGLGRLAGGRERRPGRRGMRAVVRMTVGVEHRDQPQREEG